MIVVNRKNDRITGAINGKPFNIHFDEETFQELNILAAKLQTCADKGAYNSVIEQAQELVKVDFNVEVASVNGFLKYRKNTGKYYLVINKGTKKELVSSIPLPKVLADRIVESYENGHTYMPLVLAWQRFLAKQLILPTYNPENAEKFATYLTAEFCDELQVQQLQEEQGLTEEAARAMCTISDIAVTNYGMLVTYKVVERVKKIWKFEKDENGKEVKTQVDAFPVTKTIDPVTGEVTKTVGEPKYLEEILFTPAIWKDGDKFFCGSELGYKYQVGKEHILPEDAHRNFQNTFGGGGLYAGGQAYIQGYSNDRTETLTCFIDPFDIISFQDDGRAFRTDRLFVNGALIENTELEGMYFESDYAKLSDVRIADNFKKMLEKEAELIDKNKILIDEKISLSKEIENANKK